MTQETTRLRVTLRDVEPPVERVVDVPVSTTLPELHNVLQAAFGWWDCHLHQFVTADESCYGIPDDDWPEGQIDERTAGLRDLGDRFTYHYDFGDDWLHDVQVIGPGSDEPGCVGGQGAAPPEDCGGPDGFAHLLAALADPSAQEHEHMRE